MDRETREELEKVAQDLGTSAGDPAAMVAPRPRQQRIGRDLNTSLTQDETSWLDADLG